LAELQFCAFTSAAIFLRAVEKKLPTTPQENPGANSAFRALAEPAELRKVELLR
jgi:hypothetical protein